MCRCSVIVAGMLLLAATSVSLVLGAEAAPPTAGSSDPESPSSEPQAAAVESVDGGLADGAIESREEDAGGNDLLAGCVRAFRSAQKLRRRAELLASRRALLTCAQPACPVVLTDKCVEWLRELDTLTPSILVVATDPQGRETARVRVSVDGHLLARQLDGRPFSLDPGAHKLRFEHPGSPIQYRQVVLREGEQRRRIELAFHQTPAGWRDTIAPPPAAVESEPESLTALAAISFGVAGLGVIVGAATGLWAMDELSDIEDSCTDQICPTALQDDYDQAANVAHVSTVSFVVAGVGAAVGIAALIAVALQSQPASDDEASRGVQAELTLGGARLRGWF